MKMNSLRILFLLLLIFFNHVKAQEISPYLVGNNAWYTNPTDQVWDLTAASGVKTIRIGGHSFDDNIPSKANLLSWVKKIQAMGAEPIIQVSQYQSAEIAADLVRYFNIEKSSEVAPVKYWNIGNEPWLQNSQLSGSTDVGAMVEAYFKPISTAMKEVDPTIKIFGPDFCYYVEFAINDLFGGKNDIAGKVPGKDYYYCDGISWHNYPQDESLNLAWGGIDHFKSSIIKCKTKVDQVNAAKNRTGDQALQWGIGEFNAKGGSLVHTWENGQMFGGILGLCMKYEATYATTWSMFENGGSRQGTDFSFIDGANMTPRATYRHMEFVAKFFTGEYKDGISSSDDFVVYGAQNTDHTAVMIMHRGEGTAKEYTLHLNDTATSGSNYRINVHAGQEQAYSDIIAPRATQVIIFTDTAITKINYTSEDFDQERPPAYSTFQSANALPAKPVDLKAKPISFSSIELTWTDNADNEQGFLVEREGENGYELIGVTTPDITTFTDGNLDPESTYSYKIRAYNSLGKSDYTEVASATTLAPPAPKAYNGPHSIPGVIEAEDFNDNIAGIGYYDLDEENQGGAYRSTGVDIETSTEGGYNIGYIDEGEWVMYLIEDVTPGLYNIDFRTASNTTGSKKVEVFFDDNKIGDLTPGYTGGWQIWETLQIENVQISSAEPVLMKLSFSGQEYNINWMEFVEVNNITGLREDVAKQNFKVYYNHNAQIISIAATDQTKRSEINIVNLVGRTMYNSSHSMQNKLEVSASTWARGVYVVNILSPEDRFTYKLMIN